MSSDWPIYACLVLGCMSLLTAGVFKAFSDFIMKALGQADPKSSMEAMQQINRVVLRTEFVVTLIALAPLSFGFAVYAALSLDGQLKMLIVTAALVYVPGVFGVTILGNVPLNNKLGRMALTDPMAADFWQIYLRDWTRLNHVRTAGTLVTAGLYFWSVVAAI